MKSIFLITSLIICSLHGMAQCNDNVFYPAGGACPPGANMTTSVYLCTGIGDGSQAESTSGYANTSLGTRSLEKLTTGGHNIGIGVEALRARTTASYNLAIGHVVMGYGTTGQYNTAVGHGIMYSSNASNCSAFGYSALGANGSNTNDAFGYGALGTNTSGSSNVAMGYTCLNNNSTGSYNTAVGNGALYTTTSSSSSAFGYQALHRYVAQGSTASDAFGYQALYNQTTGGSNVGFGTQALYSNSISSFNTAVGSGALYTATTGGNTAMGYQACYFNAGGSANCGFGLKAIWSTTSGTYNVGVGYLSGQYNVTGSYNTFLGAYAGFLNTATNLQNFTAVGYNAGYASSGNNEIDLGNTSVGVIKANVAPGLYSDERIKDNVKENVPGIAFITKLRPVTYNLNIHRENEILFGGRPDTALWEGKYDLEKVTQTGFIAQEVEAAAKKTGFDFSAVNKPRNENDLYSLRYSDFVVPLVKAVQEQQAIIEKQQQAIDDLNLQLQAIKECCSNTSANIVNEITNPATGYINAQLLDAIPNPTNNNTIIGYTLPGNVKTASIHLQDITGAVVQKIDLGSSRESAITISTGHMASGTYYYSLIVDGKVTATKKLIVNSK